MPRGRRPILNDSDEEMDSQPASQSQNQTQSKSQANKRAVVSPDVIKRKVSDVVQLMLIMEQKKIPVKKQDIMKNVLQDHKEIFLTVISKAKDVLSEVYGVDLVELNNLKQKVYILLNKLDMADLSHFSNWSESEPKMGLLGVILATIFMKGGLVSEKQIWHILKKLGVFPESKNHEVFGDVKKLITQEFVRQMYLEHTRTTNTDPPQYSFKWGARAKLEVTKRKALQFVSEIYGDDMPIESWRSQYQDVLRAEEGQQGSRGQPGASNNTDDDDED